MKAYKCDRCGEFFKSYKSNSLLRVCLKETTVFSVCFKESTTYSTYDRFADFCPKCQKKLERFMKNERVD